MVAGALEQAAQGALRLRVELVVVGAQAPKLPLRGRLRLRQAAEVAEGAGLRQMQTAYARDHVQRVRQERRLPRGEGEADGEEAREAPPLLRHAGGPVRHRRLPEGIRFEQARTRRLSDGARAGVHGGGCKGRL